MSSFLLRFKSGLQWPGGKGWSGVFIIGISAKLLTFLSFPGNMIMLLRLTCLLVATAFVLVSLSGAPAAEDAQKLARYLPEGANAIGVVRVAEILKSPRAQREGWADKVEAEFLDGAAVIPPWVDTLVMGTLVRPAVPEEVWTAAILELPDGTTIADVTNYDQSEIEQLAGKPATIGSRGEYLVALQPNLLGVMTPAIRQEAGRWVRRFESDQWASIPQYLRLGLLEPSHIVLALDLEDMVSPQKARALLAADDRLSEHQRLHEGLAELIDDLRGITFTAQVGDQIEAQISIDFNENVGDVAPLVKSVFVSVLEDMGASLEEFEQADVTARDKSVVLSTVISNDTLRRIMSVIISPHPVSHTASTAPEPQPAPETPQRDPESESEPAKRSRVAPTELQQSNKYFRTIDDFIGDLRRASRNSQKYAKTAAWHERFADRIENLSIAGVDPVLVDYGMRTSRNFRGLAASLRGQGVDVDAEQKTLVYNVQVDQQYSGGSFYGGWGGIGWGGSWTAPSHPSINSVGPGGIRTFYVGNDPTVNVTSNLREVRERQAQAVMAGAQDREQIWAMIEDDRSATLQDMRSKYGDEFRTGRRR